uniref:uncharacterized protein LOC122583455 n=1 Tax=Erigeron canadensis TaxID=72917 RepID=UPI001CB998A3|nr:uncharacterized protein LOC122583455 [Erigeron canadensis]
MGDISSLPADIIHNILVRLPLNLSVKLKYVCKRWNCLLSDPYYGPRGDRKILLPFASSNVDVFEDSDDDVSVENEDDNLEEKMVTLDNFANPKGNVVTESSKHVCGFGYGLTPDDLKIVRFRGCKYSSYSTNDDPHTCDVFSPKSNSWIMLRNFVRNSNLLNDVGTFSNGSLHWIAYSSINHQDHCNKIVALDVNNMVLSDIHLPFSHGSSYKSCSLGTLHGSLCIFAKMVTPGGNEFRVWVMTAGEGGEKSWLEASSLTLNLKQKLRYLYNPVIILDDGVVLILIDNELHKLVIYDAMKHLHKVIHFCET